MAIKTIKNSIGSLGRKMLYYPGWQTSRKIVVIESDDWGSLSIPGSERFNTLQSAGINVQNDPYCKFDGLAGSDDLAKLFGVLTSYKDKKGRSPVITANTIVANPDFEKIRESNFEKYYYEIFTDTLKRYGQTASAFDLWNEGICKRIFIPQFHGREHLQIFDWMRLLKSGNEQVCKAFELGVYAIPLYEENSKRDDYKAAFDCDSLQELSKIISIIEEGLDLFEQIFKYRSHSIIAPCYTWNHKIEPTLRRLGISMLQGIAFQKEPVLGKNKYRKKYNYLGKKNKSDQFYMIRNVFFEPSLYNRSDQVKKTMSRIQEAFSQNKPAVIGSHRLNYIGGLDNGNRDRNLLLLSSLLEAMLKEWPEIEFMSTAELGHLINNKEMSAGSDAI